MSLNKTAAATSLGLEELLLRDYRDIPSFLNQILERIRSLIGFDIGFAGVVETYQGQKFIVVRDKDQNFVGAQAGEWKNCLERVKVGGRNLRKHERTFIGYVAASRRPRRTGDVTKELFYRNSHPEIKSEVAVPILLDDDLLGVINLESKQPQFYTAEDEVTLSRIARLVAPKLLRMMARRGYWQSIQPVVESILAELDNVPTGVRAETGNTLSKVATLIGGALNSRSCTIWILDDKGTSLVLHGAHGHHRKFVHRHREKAGQRLTLPWLAVREGRFLRFGPRFRRPKETAKFDLSVYGKRLDTAFMICPILVRNKAIGVIKVGLKRGIGTKDSSLYSAADEELLQLIQGQLGDALHVKELEEQHRHQSTNNARRVSALTEIFAESSLVKMLEKTVQNIPRLLGAKRCSIFLWSEKRQGFILRASTDLDPRLVGEAIYRRGEGITGYVAEKGRTLNLASRSPSLLKLIDPKLVRRGKYPESAQGASQYTALLLTPIFGESEVLGVIRVADRVSRGQFTDVDEQLLAMIASRISAAIDFQKRFESQLQLVNTLDSLLERLNTSLSTSNFESGIDDFKKKVLHEATIAAARILGADVLTLYRFNSSTGEFETPPIIKGEIRHPIFMGSALRKDDVPWIIMQHGTRYWRNARTVHRLVRPIDRATRGKVRFVIREGIASAAGIRLAVGKIPVGVLFINFRTRQHFDHGMKRIIGMLGSHVAMLILIANTFYEKGKKSVERETAEQLALDLHDTVLQTLKAVVLVRAGTAIDRLANGQVIDATGDLHLVEKAASYCVEECQSIVELLRTHVVSDLGFIDALKRYRDEVWTPSGLQVDIKADPYILPISTQKQLYLIVQTAIGNVMQHSKATLARVTFRLRGQTCSLSIEDNGRGFDVPAVRDKRKGYGLQSIEKRTNDLGGALTISSAPGEGTCFTITFSTGETHHGEAAHSETTEAYPRLYRRRLVRQTGRL